MKGYYFINTDLDNTRAHTAQILQTAAAVGAHLRLTVVAPKYRSPFDAVAARERHALSREPSVIQLWNFGIRHPGALAFILYNIPCAVFLISRKLHRESFFIYVRSSLLLPVVILAFLLRVPCFYETHRRPQNAKEEWRDSLMARLSSGLVIISDYVQKYYEHFCKPMVVAHDGVSLERFGTLMSKEEARQRLNLSANDRVCVYTGSISFLKGVNYLLETAKQMPDVTFILAGRMLPEISPTSQSSNVRFLGERRQDELPTLLKAADVLVLPHPDNEYSQSPMKLFEYMASGVPIVSTKLPSVSEVLNEQNAIMVTPDSATDLASGIALALRDRDKAHKLAQQAMEDVKGYTWQARGSRIATFIEETLRSCR